MSEAGPIPVFPPALERALRAMPLMPLTLALSACMRHIAHAHPGLFRRLGAYGEARFALDPTDFPFVIVLDPRAGHPQLRVTRQAPPADCRIAGPLAALLGLVHGAYDGDALFFSRDLLIEGDTSAALALRNAIDNAELDLGAEMATLAGPLGAPLRRLLALAEQHTGVSLSRPEEPAW